MRLPGKNATLQQRVRYFVDGWLGNNPFAAFTGQDSRAFDAWCYLLQTYAVSDTPSRGAVGNAMAALLRVPQRKVLPAFKQAIASVLDWNDTEKVWAFASGPSGIVVSSGTVPVHGASS